MTAAAPKYIPMKSIVVQAYIWLAVPVVIFLAAWIRPAISIPLLACLLLAIGRIFIRPSLSPGFTSPHCARRLRFDATLILICVAVTAIVAICGIGGLGFQGDSDMAYRNALFYELVNRDWPVEYPRLTDGDPRFLCYYIGFWLPSALVAKMCGGRLLAGDIFQLLYASWGLILGVCLIFSRIHGRRRWLAFLLIFLLSGWDIADYLLYRRSFTGLWGFFSLHNDLSMAFFNFFSLPEILTNVFNQGIPAFLGLLLLYYRRENIKTFLLLFSLVFFFAPFPTMGFFPVCLIWLIKNFRRSLSWQNLLGGILCLLFGAYFLANNRGAGIGAFTYPGMGMLLWSCLKWLLFSVLIFLPFVWERVKGDWVFWVLLATAVIAPFIFLSGSPDFGWRASTAFAIYLGVAVIVKAVNIRDWKLPANICFAAVLLIAVVTPAGFLAERARLTATQWSQSEEPTRICLYDGDLSDPDFICYNYFASTGDSFFYRRLMRHPKADTPPSCGKDTDNRKTPAQ